MDGTWVLTTVNGQAVASLNPGYPIPGGGKFLRTGRLNFATLYIWNEETHNGWIDVVYGLRDAQARSLPSQTYAGRFSYHVGLREVFLTSDKGDIIGTVSGDVMTFTQRDLPLVGTATLVFRR